MKRLLFFLLFACCFWVSSTAYAQIKTSGLPVPRFVSLRSDEVNMRAGPGIRYPILWVYHKKGLPVEVIAEYDNWRRVQDINGDEGWVHVSVLSGKRNAITHAEAVAVYRAPDKTAPIVALSESNVVVKLVECTQNWCEINAAGFEGWTPKAALWGVYADEIIE